MYVSNPRFTEKNDARPTYLFAGLGAVLLLLDHILQVILHPHSRTLYIVAVLISELSSALGIYTVVGCIWHPIPKGIRADGELTTLHLDKPVDSQLHTDKPMFASIEDQTNADDDSVGMSQVEVRSPIQWAKMALVLTSVGLDAALIIIWGH
jgi:hypothetical protein